MKYIKLFEEYDFNQGDCDIYAVALHRIYGYPLYTVRNYYDNGSYEKEDGDNYLKYGIDMEDSHIVVKLPNGKYLDSEGEYTENELIDECLFAEDIGTIIIVPIDEIEALSIFGGCDYKEGEINQKINDVIKLIKQY